MANITTDNTVGFKDKIIMIIYIHGFRGSGNSNKANELKRVFGEDFVFSPTLPVSPKESIELLNEFLKTNENYPHILIGSSLGGFYAHYLYSKHDTPTLLINPSFDPYNVLENQIGMLTRFYDNAKFEWTQQHINELVDLNDDINPEDNMSSLLHFYLGKNDDVINHETIPKEFPYSDITWTNDTHKFSTGSLDKYIIPKIKLLLNITN